jgi:phosphatidylinositol alpha-mannosyltransferase
MHVCLVVPYDLAVEGGVKKHALCLAAALERSGDEVEVLGPASAPVDVRNATTFGGVVSIRSNGSDNRLALLTSPFKVRAYLQTRQFDVLHVHEPLNPMLPYYARWWANAGVNIATFHCFAERESFGRRLGRRFFAPFLRGFDRAIAVSEPAARYAQLSWRRPMSIISNGVDADFFHPRAEQPVAPSSRILFVGQWTDERKGLQVLLRAHELLRANGLDVSLDIVGRGNPKLALPKNTDGVTYHGWLSESGLRDRFHACDIFVSPALGSESFGMVLVEAMAAGKPIVCSDIEGYRQVATSEGTLLVPPNNPGALAAAMAPLVRNPSMARTMGSSNLAEARRYDWEAIAAQVRLQYVIALAEKGLTTLLPSIPRRVPKSLDSIGTHAA